MIYRIPLSTRFFITPYILGILKIDEDSKLYKTMFWIMSEIEFLRATSEIVSEEYFKRYVSLGPNFRHDKDYDFLRVLKRYFLEHGLELSEKLLSEKIWELTKYTLQIYKNHIGSSRCYRTARKKVFQPFNELEGEISIPRETYGNIVEDEEGRYACSTHTNHVGVLGDILISVYVERKVFDHEQQLWVYLQPDFNPESIQSIDVSFSILTRLKNVYSTEIIFFIGKIYDASRNA